MKSGISHNNLAVYFDSDLHCKCFYNSQILDVRGNTKQTKSARSNIFWAAGCFEQLNGSLSVETSKT